MYLSLSYCQASQRRRRIPHQLRSHSRRMRTGRHSCHPCESCSQVIVRGQCGEFVIFFHSVLFFSKGKYWSHGALPNTTLSKTLNKTPFPDVQPKCITYKYPYLRYPCPIYHRLLTCHSDHLLTSYPVSTLSPTYLPPICSPNPKWLVGQSR